MKSAKMKNFVTFLVLFTCISNICCLKLLLVFAPPRKSHYTLGNELGRGLARAGHDVTMISSFEDKNPPKGYKEIVLPQFENKTRQKNFNIYEKDNISPFFQLFFINQFGNKMSDNFFECSKIQDLLKSDEHFDAVIVEQFFTDGMKILAHHFNAPLILFSTIGANRWVNNLIGNPEPTSYVPDIFLGYTDDMNLLQRAFNFMFGIVSNLHLNLIFYTQQDWAIKKHYPNAPDLRDILYNVSLVLLNSHESVNQPIPRVPNMIDIGGFHVNPPKELPKDLKDFMDNSKEGVIYFSMGSNLIPSHMPKEKKEAILKVLGARKEKVLWKWDEDTLEDKPDNVMISKWFPQQAILAHPNCKLFITHGGLLSTIETVSLGVPILAIPLLCDQKLNAARAASLGYGKTIFFSQLREDKLAELIDELLENPSYRETVKTRSRIMHDRPIKPMDLAIYWIEYVVRHKEAPHLRVAGIKLPFYKYYMLDVIATILAGLWLTKYLLKKMCGCLKKSKKDNTERQSKTKKKRK